MNPKPQQRGVGPMASAVRDEFRRAPLAPRRLWLTAAALAIALIGLAPAAAKAAPARYIYEMCDSALPGGGDAGVHFAANDPSAFTGSDTCGQAGGSLSITETASTAARPYDASFWTIPLAAPPGGKIESVTIAGGSCNGQQANVKAFVYAPGFPPNCVEEEQHIFYEGGYGGIWEWLGCNYGNGICNSGPYVYAHYFAATEIDPVAPTVSKLEGSLLNGGTLRGHQTLSAEAHDEGGGLSNVSVSVNGLPAAQPKTPGCDVVYADNPSVKGIVAAAPTPCPTQASAEWTLNTEAFPFHEGANSVEVCASDFATLSDPNTTCSAPQSVDVDNSCTASSVAGGEVLSAQFSGSDAETVTVGYGQGAEVDGQLANDAGDPIRGATICIKAQTLGVEPQAVPVATVKTDAAGTYSYSVPPGPDRRIFVGYRHDSVQVARAVRYYAHAGPRLRAIPRRLRNGQRVRFGGQVPGPQSAGRVVVLQANVPGSKQWITFRKATTNSAGRFKSAYRFTSTTRTTTYRFRAVVPEQAGYPWVEGASRPARVHVKG
jgi:hypothetical protein